jgi:hypothetical protein
MPTSADEISWGSCLDGHNYNAPHPVWQATPTTATVLARGDYANPNPYAPYITANQYGSGYVIYDAAMQPLLGHGGFAPGMYAYLIVRRAIEWAFQSAQHPVVKVSPWPYQYNAAFMVRHDLENFVDEISNVASSAYIEFTNHAKGDYYFCTSEIVDKPNYPDIVSGLQQAATLYGATIGPHNGGLPNPSAAVCNLSNPEIYEYWHWGPDEALNTPFGYEYASNSVAISFSQIETWLPNQPTNPRVWVAPYFNATREDCLRIQEGLNVKITGDQKLTPFPSFSLSTQTDGKRYAILSEPVSDWFVSGSVAQSLDPWHAPGIHTTQTMKDGVDFYYKMGFLINFYCHALATGYRLYDPNGAAGYLSPQYVQYGMDPQLHPRLWAANARDVYQWWTNRSTVQVTAASIPTNSTHTLASVNITGAHDTTTAIEILAVGAASAVVTNILVNGVSASTNSYRTVGEVIKVLVGTTVTNVQVEYYPGPLARDDTYTATQDQPLTISAAAGVLSNDFSGSWPNLSATPVTGPSHGTLTLNGDGSFTYTPTSSFWGTECFTYQATDGQNPFGIATVTINVPRTNSILSDDFTRCVGTALTPWQVHAAGSWTLGSGLMQGIQSGAYANAYANASFTDASLEAVVSIAPGSWGGGIGGHLDPSTGAHYAAWIYPEGSPTPLGQKTLALIKFSTWNTWGYNGTNNVPMAQVSLSGAVTNVWHTLKLRFNTNRIDVFYDDNTTPKITMNDTNAPVIPAGAVSLDLYDGTFWLDNISVITP